MRHALNIPIYIRHPFEDQIFENKLGKPSKRPVITKHLKEDM